MSGRKLCPPFVFVLNTPRTMMGFVMLAQLFGANSLFVLTKETCNATLLTSSLAIPLALTLRPIGSPPKSRGGALTVTFGQAVIPLGCVRYWSIHIQVCSSTVSRLPSGLTTKLRSPVKAGIHPYSGAQFHLFGTVKVTSTLSTSIAEPLRTPNLNIAFASSSRIGSNKNSELVEEVSTLSFMCEDSLVIGIPKRSASFRMTKGTKLSFGCGFSEFRK